MPYPKTDPKVRFWNSIEFFFGDDECWIWKKAKDQDGYGILQLAKGVTAKAHRLSYEWFVGPIPEGMQVLHRCDNPSCIRPRHLFLGTHADNKKDSAVKGRLSGIYNPNSNYRKEHGKPEYLKTQFNQPQTGNGGQAGGGQPVSQAPQAAAGGGAGPLPQPGGSGSAGGPIGVAAPGVGRVNV